jgi:histone H1/5
VPPVKKASTRTSSAAKQPVALKQLTKSLDGAQAALAKLRTAFGKDVSTASKSLHKDLERFVKDARRDSRKLSDALQSDLTAAKKKLAETARPKGRKTSAKPAARKPAARKPAARKPAARKPAARKPAAK